VGERERIAPGCEETLQQRRRAPRFEVAGYDMSIKVERKQWILFACEAPLPEPCLGERERLRSTVVWWLR
jgi:hypothetical protein